MIYCIRFVTRGLVNLYIKSQLSELNQKTPRKSRRCGLRLRPSLTEVKLDMLLGNANVKFDPNRDITNKARPVSIGVIALALTPLKGAKQSLTRKMGGKNF